MLHAKHCGLVLTFLIAAGCQKSANEERAEAVKAQQEADRTAEEAARERRSEVADANLEAARKIADAQKEAREKTGEAVKDEVETVGAAQKEARDEANDATAAFQKARVDLRKSAEKELDAIDARVADLRGKLDKDTSNTKNATRANLTSVEKESKTVREDLRAFEESTAKSIDQFRIKLEKSLSSLKQRLDRVDDAV
jgi:DNA repair exonuclease SbcCD ATPase subunit